MSAIPPEILDSILDEAARQARVGRDQVSVERAEAVTWNDGSLGCPIPGELYVQMLIDGYRVVVKAGEQTFDFRVGIGGNFKICTSPIGRPPIGYVRKSVR